jgi:2-polyprenyl-3-methyl-5-hydroxy-6-metoxy-1,4-benzoquinol methylase
MKVLVAIANYGTKNQKFLDRLLREYRSMTRYDVDVVVLSNIPKELGPDVEVRVGLPIKDPWSLPFGHKALFAERADQYDLFIYSEDDTLISERHIDSFLRATAMLPRQYIAGFLRYELGEDGAKYYSTIHAHFHWDPNSVLKVADHVFAYYSNEHSASFILTREQLRAAIDSGGFMLPARKGRYDMLVTAATDPYTNCGLKKLICISHLDDFCLAHLPNVYCGRIGQEAERADREIEKLRSVCDGQVVRGPLFDTDALSEEDFGNKRYYEPCRQDILSMVPKGIRSVLSIGSGCGSTEAELLQAGAEVFGIPLDCVIGVTAEGRGLEVMPPSFDAARAALKNRRFDCVIFPDVLQHAPDPVACIRKGLEFLSPDGAVVISVPNFDLLSIRYKRLRGKLRSSRVERGPGSETSRMHLTSQRKLKKWLTASGLAPVRWGYQIAHPRYDRLGLMAFKGAAPLLSKSVAVLANRAARQDAIA